MRIRTGAPERRRGTHVRTNAGSSGSGESSAQPSERTAKDQPVEAALNGTAADGSELSAVHYAACKPRAVGPVSRALKSFDRELTGSHDIDRRARMSRVMRFATLMS